MSKVVFPFHLCSIISSGTTLAAEWNYKEKDKKASSSAPTSSNLAF